MYSERISAVTISRDMDRKQIQDAIANSCNVALMDMAAVIGVENFTKYQHIFGFGEYTGIDLPGEASTSGLLYTADTMGEIRSGYQFIRTEF